ncbi:MAG: hypothetical protein LBV69_08195 [Bacteroidales bacterium]|jgi:DNA repair exonuclease SbcCD ATPase subunit|nr:hypothetical protein [Bacteroidales bacterium]
MKKISSFLVLIFILVTSFAQKVEVKEQFHAFGKDNNHNALVTNVYFNDQKTVEKELETFLKTYKGKISNKKGLFTTDKSVVPSLSTSTVNIYATVNDTKGNNKEIEVAFAFDLGLGYVSSADYPSQYESAKTMVLNWANSLTEKTFIQLVKDNEKEIEKFQKKLDGFTSNKTSLEKENSDLNAKITDYNNKINDCKSKISTNESKMTNLEQQIQDQSAAVKQQREALEAIKTNYGK